MSIWASLPNIGHDEFEDESRGIVVSYVDGWSNHYPSPDEGPEHPSSIDLATMPPWCVPGWSEHDGDDMSCGPWLRLCVHGWLHDWHNPRDGEVTEESASVVMDEAAARELHQQLSDWLARPKVHPAVDAGSARRV